MLSELQLMPMNGMILSPVEVRARWDGCSCEQGTRPPLCQRWSERLRTALDRSRLVHVSTFCSPRFQEKGIKESLKADLDGHGSQEDLKPPPAPGAGLASVHQTPALFPRLDCLPHRGWEAGDDFPGLPSR